jgi:hypothetical protein
VFGSAKRPKTLAMFDYSLSQALADAGQLF